MFFSFLEVLKEDFTEVLKKVLWRFLRIFLLKKRGIDRFVLNHVFSVLVEA